MSAPFNVALEPIVTVGVVSVDPIVTVVAPVNVPVKLGEVISSVIARVIVPPTPLKLISASS